MYASLLGKALDFFHDVLPCSKTPPICFRASRDYFDAVRNSKCPYV